VYIQMMPAQPQVTVVSQQQRTYHTDVLLGYHRKHLGPGWTAGNLDGR